MIIYFISELILPTLIHDCIDIIYQFSKAFLDNKISMFEEYGALFYHCCNSNNTKKVCGIIYNYNKKYIHYISVNGYWISETLGYMSKIIWAKHEKVYLLTCDQQILKSACSSVQSDQSLSAQRNSILGYPKFARIFTGHTCLKVSFLISDFPDLNEAGGGIQLMNEWQFIAQSLSLSSFHHFSMT